ncbi:MAG TPA: ABC transporter permease, partial [Candidatus Solibacter sp.]|nr:ABC transporter permease [Candidatus Solibacter sp.]
MKYAVRLCARNPAFAAVAVITMAVGVGANTAIFSVANALLLRPLQYAQPDRLVLLSSELKAAGVKQGPLTYPRFTLVNERSRSFTGVAAFCAEVFNLTGRGDPEQIQAARVSWNFFDILGVHPALGRPFRAEEDQPAGAPVALIGNALWARRFASDPSAVGRSVTLDSKDYTIIGVLPPDFRFALLGLKAEIFAPRVFDLNIITPEQARAGTGFLNYVARLRPGTGIAGAQREMNALSAQYRREFPRFPDADPDLIVRVGNLRDEMVSGVRPAVLILFGAVTLVLLIACANVASLLLSRALGRKREIAVRAAIGASRAGLIRQLLTESLMLALLGGVLGALLSAWGTHALAGMAQGSLPRASEIRTDGYVMAFTLLVSMLAGIFFGLVPALQISRADLNSVLRSEGRGSTSGRRRNAMRNLLVVSQVALCMLLLIASGLLLRNFAQLRSGNPGFDPHNLLTLNVALPPARYSKPAQMAAFFSELVRQVRAVPGVRSAAGSSALPVNPSRFSPALPEGQPQLPLSQRPVFNIKMSGPGYAGTLRIPVVRGREFTERDDAHAPLVAMVNQSLARRYWPNENAVGKHILLGRIPQPLEVVGVLGDVRNLGVAADVGLEIYVPFVQRPWANINLIVRTAGDPHAFVAAVRARVLSIDADQPVTAVQTMEELLETGAAQPRFTASLLGALSATALLLAVVGIYSVIAYSVAERTHEMGIRIALGAEPADILRLVLRQGLLLALSGIAIGVAASFALTRLMASLLYHVSVTDPATFAIGSLLFAAVALLASYLPARRA